MTQETPTLSVVLPCLNEASHIEGTVAAIREALVAAGVDHELVLVDDGSTDGTWEALARLAGEGGGVRALRLSRRFGKEHALCAGLEAARGAGVLVMDADLQHPPALIPDMVRAWREEGFEVVEAKKTDRGDESLFARFEAGLFYAFLRRLSGIDLSGASDFKLMDRKVIEAWAEMPERNLFFRGMSAWLGFRRKELAFSVESRAGGRSGWSVRGLVRLAITGITAFSSVPIHLVTLMGLVFLAFAGVLGVQTLYNKVSGVAVDGFTTVILLLLITGSALMIGLGIIGVYVSRIYDEVKGRPRYVVAERAGEARGSA
jgi:glycosyltransferase involved in cell wall biosynthesis